MAKPVETLLSIQNDKTIVLYTDGTCESLESAIETRKLKKDLLDPRDKPIIDPETTAILHPTYFKCANNKLLLTYFTRSADASEVQLICFMIDDETLQIDGVANKLKLFREQSGIKLAGFTVINSTVVPQLVTICEC